MAEKKAGFVTIAGYPARQRQNRPTWYAKAPKSQGQFPCVPNCVLWFCVPTHFCESRSAGKSSDFTLGAGVKQLTASACFPDCSRRITSCWPLPSCFADHAMRSPLPVTASSLPWHRFGADREPSCASRTSIRVIWPRLIAFAAHQPVHHWLVRQAGYPVSALVSKAYKPFAEVGALSACPALVRWLAGRLDGVCEG